MTAPKKFTLPVACVLACCLLAACGSSSSSSSSSSAAASGSSGPASATRTKFVECLKQHGVTVPARPGGFLGRRPGSGGGGTSGGGGSGAPYGGGSAGGGAPGAGGIFGGGGGSRNRFQANPKLQAAFKACAADLPARRFRFNPAARRTLITNFVKCVRQHGYNLPQPNFSGGPVFPRKIETNAKFKAASKACAHLLIGSGPPQGQGGGAPGSGTAGGQPQSS